MQNIYLFSLTSNSYFPVKMLMATDWDHWYINLSYSVAPSLSVLISFDYWLSRAWWWCHGRYRPSTPSIDWSLPIMRKVYTCVTFYLCVTQSCATLLVCLSIWFLCVFCVCMCVFCDFFFTCVTFLCAFFRGVGHDVIKILNFSAIKCKFNRCLNNCIYRQRYL